MHCHSCHLPASYSNTEWEVVMMHMRVRANLTSEEQKKISNSSRRELDLRNSAQENENGCAATSASSFARSGAITGSSATRTVPMVWTTSSLSKEECSLGKAMDCPLLGAKAS